MSFHCSYLSISLLPVGHLPPVPDTAQVRDVPGRQCADHSDVQLTPSKVRERERNTTYFLTNSSEPPSSVFQISTSNISCLLSFFAFLSSKEFNALLPNHQQINIIHFEFCGEYSHFMLCRWDSPQTPEDLEPDELKSHRPPADV